MHLTETAFADLAHAHRRELHAHCYRMLGSLSEAEDAVQETLIKAWRGLATFEERASLRTWLYKIATNTCLDELAKRRSKIVPTDAFPAATPGAPLAPALEPSAFIDPCPEGLWGATPSSADARFTARESVTLAFVAALEHLSPMQRAALLLRDVLGFSAAEAALILDKTPPAVESALDRARAAVPSPKPLPPAAGQRELLGRYLRAWESKDVSALTVLLRDDVTLAMPPMPAWFSGRDHVAAFFASLLPSLGAIRGQIISVAGGLGLALWVRAPGDRTFNATGISAICSEGAQVVTIDTYLTPRLFAHFGLDVHLSA